jgi:hypothetical protein
MVTVSGKYARTLTFENFSGGREFIRNDDSVTWGPGEGGGVWGGDLPGKDCSGTGAGRPGEEERAGGEGEEEAEEAEDVVTARGRRRGEEEVICNVCWEPLRGGKECVVQSV